MSGIASSSVRTFGALSPVGVITILPGASSALTVKEAAYQTGFSETHARKWLKGNHTMRNLWRVTPLVLVLLSLLHSVVRADKLEGIWQVNALTTKHIPLDGKVKSKGAVTTKPKGMWIEVTSTHFLSHDAEKVMRYSLLKKGQDYLLSQNATQGARPVSLTNVKRTANQLSFTITRQNRARTEIVHMVCSPLLSMTNPAIYLTGTHWTLIEILYSDGKEIKPKKGEKMTLEFGKNGQVSGRAGVNRFTSTSQGKNDGSFALGKVTTTRAANPPGSIADAYLKILKSAERYIFNKGVLVLELPYGSGEMTFRRSQGEPK